MAALLLPALLACAPQQDPAVIARYQMLGKEAVVAREDVALEMAFQHNRKVASWAAR